MAIVLYGGGIVDMRGSISGTTHSRSKFGATMRAKTSPVQPTSNLASASRSLLPSVTRDWNQLLTPTERAAWNAFALINPATNVFGQTSYLSGAQWYTRTQINIILSGGARYTSPPASGSYPGYVSLSVTVTSGSPDVLTFDHDGTFPSGTPYAHLFASPNLSPGISYANSVLRDIGFISTSTGIATTTFATNWKTRFSDVPLLVGKQIFLLAAVMDQDTGIQSPGIIASAIVT